MQTNKPYILAAMDGKETPDTASSESRFREDPTIFFYILFGLVYDALTDASTDAATGLASREATIAALQTLKYLVRREYAGKAILEPAIFKEFSSLCYRMAVTESAAVQLHLVDVITALASSHKSSSSALSVFFFHLFFLLVLKSVA